MNLTDHPPINHWVYIVETDCEPTREAKFEDWYEGVHIPDVLQTPGFTRATRYQAKELRDGRGQYMALYEIETADIEGTMKLRNERRAEEHKLGRAGSNIPHLLTPIWRDILFRQIFERTAPQNSAGTAGKWLNFVENYSDPLREDEYHHWYNDIHLPDVLKTPGFVGARRYRIKEPRDGRGTYLAIYEIETDDIDATMQLRMEHRAEAVRQGRGSSNRPHLVRPVWNDVLWRRLSQQTAKA